MSERSILTQHIGSPAELGRKAFDTLTAGKGPIQKIGVGLCLTKNPELYLYAGIAGVGFGVFSTLLLVFVYNTIVHRHRRAAK